jgi:hypothetical protein
MPPVPPDARGSMNLTPQSGGVPGPLPPSPGPRWPANWAGRGLMSVIGRSVRAFSEVASFMNTSGLGKDWPQNLSTSSETERRLDESNWPSRPLRIGLVRTGSWATRLMNAAGTWETEWLNVPDAEGPSLCREHVLDALVRPMGGNGLEVELAENSGKDAAWFEWSRCCPLSYPAAFPARVDTARLCLSDAINDDPALVLPLIETAALLSRHPARLTREDRVNGRRPFHGPWDASPTRAEAAPPVADAQQFAMERLAETFTTTHATDAARTLSRVLGAYLATAPSWTSDAARIASMDACARISGDEPQTMLRLAAVRLGMGQDEAGLDAIERADRMLRDGQLVSATDQEAFIRAELDHGHPGPLTIGRLAAGICLLVSTMPASRVPYFRDDLLDDMRFSSLLIGRDQDRKLLMQVFRVLERVRRAESFGLPTAAANAQSATPAPASRPLPFNRAIATGSKKRPAAKAKKPQPKAAARPRKKAA